MKAQIASFLTMDKLHTSVVILDSLGTIIAVNDVWKTFGRTNGLRIARSAVGENYLEYCRADDPDLRRFARDLRALLKGRLDLVTFVYPCHSPSRKRWFVLIAAPLSRGEPAGAALLHVDVTKLLMPLSNERLAKSASRRQHNSRGTVEKNMIDAVLASTIKDLFFRDRTMAFPPIRRVFRSEPKAQRTRDSRRLSPRAQLTRRQLQVLALLQQGKTNKEIASALTRSPNTVKLHVSAILRRLELKSRTEAALFTSGIDWHC